MANWQQIARQEARRAGIDPNVFARQIQQESGFNPRAVSPAGAIGIAQIIPSTARAWGVNPRDPGASLRAAARHMAQYVKQFGGYRNALIAYNAGPGAVGRPLPAETRNYIRTILGPGNGPRGVSAPARGLPGAPGMFLGGAGAAPDTTSNAQMVGLLQQLAQQQRQQAAASSAQLQAPAFSAAPPLPAGYQQVQSGGGPGPKLDINALVQSIQTPAGNPLAASDNTVAVAPRMGTPAPTPGGTAPHTRLGRVTVAPGANRAGVGLKPQVTQFAREIAGLVGGPVRIGTGTNHSRLTVSGRVSDHWGGWGADVPAAGRALIRLGQAALVAAGMDPAKAAKQRGGLYNVRQPGGRVVQVIFNTDGPGIGNHRNHLHFGLEGF